MSTLHDEPTHESACASTHVVRFYRDDVALLAEVAEFLGQGLRNDGVAIIIASAGHADALRQQLTGLGSMEGRRSVAPDRLLVLDADEALSRFMVADWPDERLFEAAIGSIVRNACARSDTVHAFGEMVAVLCARGLYDAAVRLEELWNGLARACRFELFCAYPWQQFSTDEQAAAFQRICNEHDRVCAADRPDQEREVDLARRVAILEQQNLALRNEAARAREAEAALRQRERELADFLENAAEGLHRVGADGTILWANRAELKMLGYRWEEYVGRHIAEFHADDDVIESILQRLQRGETLHDEPARLRCKDGSIRHVVISSNGCFDDGSLRHTRCFTRDATERQLLERLCDEREALVTKLSQANRAKDEFLAMLAHELRNPLAPVGAAAQLLAIAAEDPQRVRQAAAVIRRQVGHMTGLIDDLLDVARVTRGLIVLTKMPLDLREVVTEAVEQAAPQTQARRHRLQLDLPQEPALVNADRKRIIQVLSNILVNANKFTPDGGRIGIRLETTDQEVRLTVSDTGIGMDADLAAQVFDLFVQGRRTLDRATGGLGLGLALARSLVEAHGGAIAAASDGPGLGSSFTIRLPRLRDDGSWTASADEPPLARPAPRPLRVTVVDDNRDAADALAALLSAMGHRATAQYSSTTALEVAATRCPDVFLLDIGLPDIDGLELARRLRAMPEAAGVSLVAVTGYNQAQDRESTRAAGFDQHLAKPVDTAALLAILAQVAGRLDGGGAS